MVYVREFRRIPTVSNRHEWILKKTFTITMRILLLKIKGCCFLLELKIVFHRERAHHGEGDTQNAREITN